MQAIFKINSEYSKIKLMLLVDRLVKKELGFNYLKYVLEIK